MGFLWVFGMAIREGIKRYTCHWKICCYTNLMTSLTLHDGLFYEILAR